MSEPQENHAHPKAVSKHENSDVKPPRRRGVRFMDLLINAFGLLAIISGGVLAIVGIFTHWKNKETVAIWAFYFTIVFALSAFFAFWQKRICEGQSVVPQQRGLEVTSAKVFRGKIRENPPTSQPHQPQAQIIAENSELLVGDVPILEVTLTNNGDNIAREAKPLAIISLGKMIGENPTYHGNPTSPIQTVQDVPKGGFMVLDIPFHRVLTQEDLNAIAGYQQYLIIYGVVTYIDSGRPRKTRFCYLYNPRVFRMSPCPAHNSIE